MLGINQSKSFLDDCKDYWDDAYDEIIQEIKELD